MPDQFSLYALNHAQVVLDLLNTPHENDLPVYQSTVLIDLPIGNNQFETFRVVKAPVMDPLLAAKYPGIHSYLGKGLKNPGMIARFDVSPYGMNALIFMPNAPTVYIDHIEGNFYRVSSRDDIDMHKTFRCLTDAISTNLTNETARPLNANQPRLRKYRLALLSGAEFSLHFVQPSDNTDALKKARVLAQQNAQMTRANALFERDLSIRMILVPNNDTIIYLNAATDPVSNATNPNQTQLENAINARIGSANYDIGHTGTKGQDNGNAGCIGCVCRTGKGQGYTAYSNPSLLDFYVIDYLVHEMGHQMGGNHTFSYETEGTGVNVEPGSGITVMGYAGITGNTDVANHSLDHYHARTIGQITNYLYIGGGNACAVSEDNSNAIPTANAGRDYIIPRSTPFALTGSGSDADANDVITYVWEQNDNKTGNGSSIPSATFTSGPMFRAYSPKTSPTTLFPSLQYILNGTNNNTWEVLPSVTRNLNFILTVRDNHGFGGGTASDNMIVSVNGSTGPFAVSSPNTTAINWRALTRQEVRWSVANSNAAPVNCAKVKISLSTDGGFTWPYVLNDSTANDGSDSVNVPNAVTTQARIKVEAVGNIFFDISNANFTVSAPPQGFEFVQPATITTACGANISQSVTLNTVSNGGFNTPVVLSASGNPIGTNVTFNPSTVTPGNSTVVTISGTNNIAPGTYSITVTGTAGALTNTTTITLNVTNGAPPRFIAQPANVSVCEGATANFSGNATDALNINYQWQMSVDGGNSYTTISGANTNALSLNAVTASMNGNLYRLTASATCGISNSNTALLTVNANPTITTDPLSSTVCAGSNLTLSTVAVGAGIQYQWQISNDGGLSFSNIPGANGSTYAVQNISVANDGQQYRVFVTGSCAGADTSSAATLTLGTAPVIQTQPISQTLCEGDTLRMITSASGNNIQYQWQLSTDAGQNFTDIQGASDATYLMPSVLPIMNGNQYRVIARLNGCSLETISNVATLTVKAKPSFSIQPVNDTACFQSGANFFASATGNNLTYQWQISTNGGNTYGNINGAIDTFYSIASVALNNNNNRFKLLVTGECGTVESNIVTLSVQVLPNFQNNGGQPTNVTVCEGLPATYRVQLAGQQGILNGTLYQWQESVDGGTNYANISGATTNTYNINSTAITQSGNLYRVYIYKSACPFRYSNSASLTVNASPVVSTISQKDTVCSGETISITASGASTYVWSPNNETSATITVTPTVVTQNPETRTYSVTGKDQNGCESQSSSVQITVGPKPTVSLTASGSTILSTGESVTLNTNATPDFGNVWTWYKDQVDLQLPNNTTSLTAGVSDTGLYKVSTTSIFGCTDEVDIRISFSRDLVFYPNPNKGLFNVDYSSLLKLPSTKNLTFTVFDGQGKRVYMKTILSNEYQPKHEFNLRNVNSGIYIVIINDATGNKIATNKIIVNP
jgi:hypothetical protein